MESKTRQITSIGVGLAAMIAGGFIIYQFSSIVPIPGMKYLLMAPYLSMIIYLLISMVDMRYPLLVIGSAFSGIMVMINIFMGISILITSLLAQIAILPVKKKKSKARIGAVVFAGMTGTVALSISKIFIGGLYDQVTFTWICTAFLIASLFGVLGAYLAEKIMRYVIRGIKS